MIRSLVRHRLPRLQCTRFVRHLQTTPASQPIEPPFDALAAALSSKNQSLDQLTRLPNGVRVATESTPGHFSAVGVFVECGSRHEDEPEFRGVSHIVDRLAFKSTRARTEDEMMAALDALGGNHMCSSSREAIMYTSSVFNGDVAAMTELLAETVLHPLITEEEVSAQLATAEYEAGEIWQKPEMILPELLHAAAYRENTLGHPLLCPEERLPYINAASVQRYRDTFYRPERIVVGFVGVPHADAVHLATKFFGEVPSPSPSSPSTAMPSITHEKNDQYSAVAQYTGGSLFLPAAALPNEQWTHLQIAFEAPDLSSPQLYALATLQILLGGGGSFSAGGPGKGMYSRLYTNVLNQYGWIESCTAFHHVYRDSALFGIAASSRPDAAYAMSNVIAREFQLLTSTGSKGIGRVEAERAKNQLRSGLLMNLESRMITLEDLGRQVQSLGRRISAEEMCHHIESLSVADLRRAAESVLSGFGGRGTGAATVLGAGPGVEKVGNVYSVLERAGLGRP